MSRTTFTSFFLNLLGEIMKLLLVLVFVGLASFSATREEDYFSEEGFDCSAFSGTYSTLFELTYGTLAQNYVFKSLEDYTDNFETYYYTYDAQVPDVPGRIAIYDDCQFILNLNADADAFTNYKYYDVRSNNTEARKAYHSNSDGEFLFPFIPYEGIVSGNSYLCGVATQNGYGYVYTGPNFAINSPSPGRNNYLQGSQCTIVDRQTILCSLIFFSGSESHDVPYIEGSTTVNANVGMNFRASLTLRNHDIDDDIDADVSGVTFLTECATRPLILAQTQP